MNRAGDRQFSMRTVAASTMLLTAATVGGQVLTVGRELFVAGQVGLSPRLDALLIALIVPTVLSGVLSSGTSAALLPAYMEARQRRGHDEARRLAGGVLTWIGCIGLALTALMLTAGAPIIGLFGPGLDAPARAVALEFLPVLAPIAVVSALSSVLMAVCQAEDRFTAIAGSALAGSVAALIATWGLWPQLDLTALGVGMSAGASATLVALIISVIRGAIYPKVTLRIDGAELRELARHAGPLTASSLVLQLNVIADRAIASLIAPGAVSALRYAEVLVRAPIGAIGPAWGRSIYPSLTQAARQDDPAVLGSAVVTSLRYVIAVFVPLAAAGVALAPSVVELAFGRGAFSANDVELTARVLAAFAPLILILMIHPILIGAHNARRRGKLLLTSGILNAVLNLGLNLVFGSLIGVAGIALSTSVTAAVLMFFLARRLATVEPVGLSRVWHALSRACAAAAVPALPVGIIAWTGRMPDSTALGTVMVLGLVIAIFATYFALCARWGFAEPSKALRFVVESAASYLIKRGARP